MDDTLVPFYRQYLQQISPTTIRYPSSKALSSLYIQGQLHRYFFDGEHDPNLPPPDYQRRVLKKILRDVERELARNVYDDTEYGILDELMAYMGILSTIPQPTDAESAQTQRTLSYIIPSNDNDTRNEKRILIRESPNLLAAGSNVGLRTWEASLHLAYYLCTCPRLEIYHHNRTAVKDANIIELGAGTGLLSLVLAHGLGAQHVVATDGLPHVVDGIEGNIRLNTLPDQPQARKSITAARLDWTDPDALDSVLHSNTHVSSYEYVLGADITYHPELFDPLAKVLKQLKQRHPAARILIGATVRNEATLQRFRQVCTDDYGFTIRDIPDDEWKCPDFTEQKGLFHEQAFPILIMDLDLVR